MGKISFISKAILAPMAGYTDAPYRFLCAKYGAGGACSELLSSSAILRRNKKTYEMVRRRGESYPLGMQIFGSNEEDIANAARALCAMAERGECDAKFIDLNFGCPAKKVVKEGAGSAMLSDPKKVGKIVASCVKKCELPITAKIRLGFKGRNYLEVAREIEDAGASALAVHCRTKDEGFSEKFDWGAIREVKERAGIPIIGNGGVRVPQDAGRMMEETSCDYVMVGRAALGNPFFFCGEANPSREKREKGFLEYLEIAGRMGCLGMAYARAHAIEFASGFEGAARIREKIAKCKRADLLAELFRQE